MKCDICGISRKTNTLPDGWYSLTKTKQYTNPVGKHMLNAKLEECLYRSISMQQVCDVCADRLWQMQHHAEWEMHRKLENTMCKYIFKERRRRKQPIQVPLPEKHHA